MTNKFVWPLLTKEALDGFFGKVVIENPVKACECNLMTSGCVCGAMDEEMREKGFVRAKFGPERWVKIDRG